MKVFGILLAGVSFAAFASAAVAADMPLEDPVPVIDTSVAHDWTGFYAGVFGAYSMGDVDWTGDLALVVGDPDYEGSFGANGWLAGVDLGVNQQVGSFVLGVEGDLAWANLSGEGGPIDPAHNFPTAPSADVNWMSTLRARVGVPIDNLLLYATGGLAVAGADVTLTNVTDAGNSDDRTRSSTLFGWTAGVGAELAVTDSMSIKAEYLYADMSSGDIGFGSTDGGDLTATGHLTSHTVKLGVNFGF